MIVNDQVLQFGDLYKGFRLIGVDYNGAVLEEAASREFYKYLENGEPSEVVDRRAKYEFIVNQMKAIHQAQVDYQQTQGKGFAPDLETLISQSYLADGFESYYQKHGYVFRVVETKEYYGKDPSFLAVAEPLEEGDLYFSVDELGQVRTADTLAQIDWGPVWDYYEKNMTKIESVDISVQE